MHSSPYANQRPTEELPYTTYAANPMVERGGSTNTAHLLAVDWK